MCKTVILSKLLVDDQLKLNSSFTEKREMTALCHYRRLDMYKNNDRPAESFIVLSCANCTFVNCQSESR